MVFILQNNILVLTLEMLRVTFFSIILYIYVNADEPSSFVFPCKTPNDEDGLCVSLLKCPAVLQALGTLKSSASEFLQQSKCSNHIPNTIIVCCGTYGNYIYNKNQTTVLTETVPLQVTTATESTSNVPILTTNSSSSVTINVNSKESIFNNTVHQSIATTNETTEQNFNQSLVVNANQTISNSLNQTIASQVNSSVEEHRVYVKRRLLPNRMYCGLQHTDDRYYTDKNTALDEFPWAVHVIFLIDEDEDPDQYLDRCNGVLISNRYVLTSEYCATFAPSVRLGQHFTNQTIACTNDTDITDCNEPRIDIEVVEEIHRENVSNAWHNFALLRLAKKVTFTDFVRPICLNLDYSDVPKTHDSLIFSGWGATGPKNVNKKRLTYNVTQNINECLKWDDKDLKNASARGEVVCLIPRESGGELVCTGDEGGPLTYPHRHQWFVEGLITRVYDKITDEKCSNELPISGVKITSDVLNWILDNMHD